MPKNLPVDVDEGPKDGKQIIERIGNQVFAAEIETSADEGIEEGNNMENQETPEESWLDKEDRLTQLTTMSQSMLLSHNFGICDIVQADGVSCDIPTSGELNLGINTDLYQDMLARTKSLGHLVAKVTHVIITPKLLLKKIREKRDGNKIAENTLSTKIICAWTWIMLQSQALYPPSGLRKEYTVETRSGSSMY